MLSAIFLTLILFSPSLAYWPYTIDKERCISECVKYDNYYFCYTQNSWNYCSPSENVGYKGNECKQTHKCDFHGERYTWCYLEQGSWEECSKGYIEDTPLALSKKKAYYSTYYCKDSCSKKGYNYNWCYTFKDWDYCDPDAINTLPKWYGFKINKCSIPHNGMAIYKAYILNPPNNMINSICKTYPLKDLQGQKIGLPLSCSYEKLSMKIVGEFRAVYDKAIDPYSSIECYSFEFESLCNDISLNRVRRSKKDKCFGAPFNFYNIFYLVQLIKELIRQNYQVRTIEEIPSPQPEVTTNYPGLFGQRVRNPFVSNGNYSFRLLRSEAQERINERRDGVYYQRKQPEGNGLDGLIPTDTFGRNTLYDHVITGAFRSRFISSTVDFGRTKNLAINQALRSFDEESRNFNGRRGFSRFFVQIDLRNLDSYDLTNSDELNEHGLTPSGALDPQVVNFARSWSEIVIDGVIPSGSIVRVFEIYSVNQTHYIMIVKENPNYRP